MSSNPTREGHIPFRAPNGAECFTYFVVIGDLACGKPPVVLLHGGPGGGHEYLLPFEALWRRYGIPVILYDQIGCANSSRLQEFDGDKSFWTIDIFIKELENILEYFKLSEGIGYHLLGQSWGGMLAAVLATRRPKGLRRIILASAIASQQSALEGYRELAKLLSKEDQEAIQEAVVSQDFQLPRYRQAMDHFRRAFLCRSDPYPPPELAPAMRNLANSTIWKTMMGDSLYDPSRGVLANWSIIHELPKVDVPTLVYSGEFDTSHEICTKPFIENIPQVRRFIFADAGHMLHLETKERLEECLELVGNFLTEEDKAIGPGVGFRI